MVTSIPQSEGIVIPILGLCIIFALAVAAYLEPKKDYSRRVYIFMGDLPESTGSAAAVGGLFETFHTEGRDKVFDTQYLIGKGIVYQRAVGERQKYAVIVLLTEPDDVVFSDKRLSARVDVHETTTDVAVFFLARITGFDGAVAFTAVTVISADGGVGEPPQYLVALILYVPASEGTKDQSSTAKVSP